MSNLLWWSATLGWEGTTKLQQTEVPNCRSLTVVGWGQAVVISNWFFPSACKVIRQSWNTKLINGAGGGTKEARLCLSGVPTTSSIYSDSTTGTFSVDLPSWTKFGKVVAAGGNEVEGPEANEANSTYDILPLALLKPSFSQRLFFRELLFKMIFAWCEYLGGGEGREIRTYLKVCNIFIIQVVLFVSFFYNTNSTFFLFLRALF